MGIYTLSFLDTCVPLRSDGKPIENPLDCIADHHLAERQVCAEIDRIAHGDGQGDGNAVESQNLADVIRFLSVELPIHLQDEAEDLFPTLRARCESEDEIDRIIDRLSAEHAHSGTEREAVLSVLRGQQRPGAELSDADRAALTDFAAHARRHLIFENAIVMPIARVRLSSADLARMRHRMMHRRQRYWIGEDRDAE